MGFYIIPPLHQYQFVDIIILTGFNIILHMRDNICYLILWFGKKSQILSSVENHFKTHCTMGCYIIPHLHQFVDNITSTGFNIILCTRDDICYFILWFGKKSQILSSVENHCKTHCTRGFYIIPPLHQYQFVDIIISTGFNIILCTRDNICYFILWFGKRVRYYLV